VVVRRVQTIDDDIGAARGFDHICAATIEADSPPCLRKGAGGVAADFARRAEDEDGFAHGGLLFWNPLSPIRNMLGIAKKRGLCIHY